VDSIKIRQGLIHQEDWLLWGFQASCELKRFPGAEYYSSSTIMEVRRELARLALVIYIWSATVHSHRIHRTTYIFSYHLREVFILIIDHLCQNISELDLNAETQCRDRGRYNDSRMFSEAACASGGAGIG
jgi:hypothetical protein